MTSPSTMDNYDDSFEMNTTEVTKHSPAYKKGYTLALQQEEYTPDLIIPLTVIYLAIFIAGVLGNLATCLVIGKDKAMQTVTNYYLFNLAISDLILLIFAVALSFLVCWAPFHVQRLVAIYGIRMDYPSDNFVTTYTVLTCLSGVLYFLSTAINPVLYSIMSKKFRDAFKRTLESWCEERPPRCQTYSTLLAAQRREEINTREAERARARRLRGFIAAEIHNEPARAQRFNERDVRVVFESSSSHSSHGFWSRGSRFGHNEPSHSVESRVTISNSSLHEVDLELAGEELATCHVCSPSVGLTFDTYV